MLPQILLSEKEFWTLVEIDDRYISYNERSSQGNTNIKSLTIDDCLQDKEYLSNIRNRYNPQTFEYNLFDSKIKTINNIERELKLVA